MQTPRLQELIALRPINLWLGWCQYWKRQGTASVRQQGVETADLISRASAGDGEAFSELTQPYRRELQVHCYRMLGSLQDAEDALQDSLLTAWQGIGRFEGRSSVRTWLYRIATNRCLNVLRTASRRPAKEWEMPEVEPPEPTGLGEVVWLEPYPDSLLESAIDMPPGPEAVYEQSDAISLAFVTALQVYLPASAPCSSSARCSATTPTRWPTCSTRRSLRSIALYTGPGRLCSAACLGPAGKNRLLLPAHLPSGRS